MELNEQIERRRKLIARVTRAWARADQFENPLTASQLAEEAVSAILDPETWTAGDTIPPEVDLVDDSGGFRFERIRIAEGQDTGHWRVVEAQHLSQEDMLARFGPVREASPDDVSLRVRTEQWPTVGEDCPVCGVVALVAGPDGVTVRCPQCRKLFMDRAQRPESRADAGDQCQTPHYDPLTICPNCHDVVDATIYCSETHPDTGWVCDKPADHETGGEVGDQWHHWSNVGKTWKETLTEQLASALEFVNYIITQGSAPGTATITKKIVNRAQGRARDLERALMLAADREAL